jgi:estrogen-related receptor ERR
MMGMLKEGVRLDRVRGGRQKYRRNPNMQPYQLQIPHSSTQPPQSLDDIKLLDVLVTFEPERLCVGHCGIDLMNKNDNDQKNECVVTDAQEMLNILSDLYDKELVGVIGWAKQISGKRAKQFLCLKKFYATLKKLFLASTNRSKKVTLN